MPTILLHIPQIDDDPNTNTTNANTVGHNTPDSNNRPAANGTANTNRFFTHCFGRHANSMERISEIDESR